MIHSGKVSFAVEDLDSKRVIKVGERTDERPGLLTAEPPFTAKLSYHQLSDELHEWFRETLGMGYQRQVHVISVNRRIKILFNERQTALLFKLRWGGK
jgi:adenine-specific DNA methylase